MEGPNAARYQLSLYSHEDFRGSTKRYIKATVAVTNVMRIAT
jgi:hypothetical protein